METQKNDRSEFTDGMAISGLNENSTEGMATSELNANSVEGMATSELNGNSENEMAVSDLNANRTASALSVAEEAEKAEKAEHFKKMAIPCMIYSLIYIICMRDNYCGITMPIWIASLSGLVLHLSVAFNHKIKKDSYFIVTIMMLIAISTFITGNTDIIILNYMAEFLLVLSLVLHNFADDSNWDFGSYIEKMIYSTFGCLTLIGFPVSDGIAYRSQTDKVKNGKKRNIVLGVVIAIPCLLGLGALLASADAVFGSLVSDFFSKIAISDYTLVTLIMLLFGFFGSYCGIRFVEKNAKNMTVKDRRNGDAVIAITVTALISLLYLVFSVIQILYLFIGKFTLPDGMTYAEYARTGFFQLLAVCIINLILVMIVKKYFKADKVLDRILLVISLCTYIMVASSAIRMLMYINAYYLTLFRVMVLVGLFAIALLLVGIIIYIFNEKFNFFRYGVAVISVIYVLFAFSHVDYFVADYNLKMNNASDYYLADLSSDAAPAYIKYFEEHDINPVENNKYAWYKDYVSTQLYEAEDMQGIRKFNVSHYRAGKLLDFEKLKQNGDYN